MLELSSNTECAQGWIHYKNNKKYIRFRAQSWISNLDKKESIFLLLHLIILLECLTTKLASELKEWKVSFLVEKPFIRVIWNLNGKFKMSDKNNVLDENDLRLSNLWLTIPFQGTRESSMPFMPREEEIRLLLQRQTTAQLKFGTREERVTSTIWSVATRWHLWRSTTPPIKSFARASIMLSRFTTEEPSGYE